MVFRKGLAYPFAVAAEDQDVADYLQLLFSGLEGCSRAEHRFQIRGPGEDSSTGAELWVDEQRVRSADHQEDLIGPLVHEVNRRAIVESPFLTLHAGAISQSGTAVVMPGMMEAGKTTLTAGLVRAGFDYLTDEAAALDRQTLRIHPYAKPLSIDPGAWALFPELEPQADLGSEGYKRDQWQVPPSAIRPDAVGRPCAVGVVMFPRFVAGAETVLEPIGRAEALVELAKNTFSFKDRGAPELDLLADLARRVECYRLTMGRLDDAVGLVVGLLGADPAQEARG